MITIWKTREGQEIEIKKMTTEHIKNCIKAIKQKRIIIGTSIDVGYTGDEDGDGIIYDWIDTSNDYIQAFEEELKKRGGINASI